MKDLAESLKFYDTGNVKRNKENFQGYLFEGIDQRLSKEPISFYRSDFRGTKIRNCWFLRNDFSRADFIDSLIEATSFENCIFKYSEFYNCFFDRSVFTDTHFKSASFSRMLFNECEVRNAGLQDVTVRDCSFEQCKISSTSFVQNSFDEVKFNNCNLTDIDLSNMTAINLYFTNCTFSNLVIEADFLGSYFFKDTYFDEVRMKYRGRIFKLDIKKQELLGNLFKIFLESKRYYEAINILIQKNLLQKPQTSVFEITKFAFKELLMEGNFLRRSYQIEKIFQLFEFYFNSSYVTIDDYFKLIEFAEELDVSELPIQEQMNILTSIQRLKSMFQVVDLSNPFIQTSLLDLAVLEIKVDDRNEKLLIPAFENVLYHLINKPESQDKIYAVIGKRKGSIIFEIAINAMVALIILKMLKTGLRQIRGISNEMIQIAVDFSINRKLLLEANKAKTIRKLKDIKQLQTLSAKAIDSKPENNEEKINELLSVVESVKYFPNTLLKSDQ